MPAVQSALPIAPARRVIVLLAVLSAALLAALGGASNALALDVNVRSAPYNATGNGTTNDRAAIQSAIDAVNAAGGGTVNLPGTYTYLTGNLILKSNVTLNLNSGATLKQSQVLTDYANTPTRGRVIPGSTVQFITYLDQNYPLVYAGNASNVKVTGTGTIQLTRNGNDDNTINLHGIGLHYVTDYEISNITIAGASAYNVTVRNTDRGTISGVTTTTPATLNSDGISIMNSSDISVHDNHLTTLDDGIYVWASYDDPRRSAWWNSDTPRPSRNIHVYDNVVDNQAGNGSHGFVFINWTEGAPDQSQVEISHVNVHDNTFEATYPIGALNDDIYHCCGSKTPSKNLTFLNNTLVLDTAGSTTPLISRNLDGMATTELKTDNPTVYNFGRATNELYNSNFDGLNAFAAEVGTSFWSVEGAATTPSTAVGQPGGRYGQIASFNSGYAGIYQGVHLTPGTYTVSASTQSNGSAVRFFAIRATGTSVMASTSFTNTGWATQTLSFTVTTADTYRLGIDSQPSSGSSTAWGRIDSVVLTKTS